MSTKPISVNDLREGSYVVIDGVACIVKSIQKSKPGKHGSAKCRVEAIGIIDNQKRIFIKPAHDSIETPIIEKKAAQVLSISNEVANVMDLTSYETFDLKIPDELKGKVTEGIQVVYWIILNDKLLKQAK